MTAKIAWFRNEIIEASESNPAFGRRGARWKELFMGKHLFKSGKQTRPKTAAKGKRYRCAKCRKRSPKPVKTPAPWYCPRCLQEREAGDTAI